MASTTSGGVRGYTAITRRGLQSCRRRRPAARSAYQRIRAAGPSEEPAAVRLESVSGRRARRRASERLERNFARLFNHQHLNRGTSEPVCEPGVGITVQHRRSAPVSNDQYSDS